MTTICTHIALEGAMDTLALKFLTGRKVSVIRYQLPKTIVTERDDEYNAVKSRGPFKNGKLRASVIYRITDEAMTYFCGPDWKDATERVKLWTEQMSSFPARLGRSEKNFRNVVADVRDWAVRLLEFDTETPGSLDAFVLHRSIVRVFNSWATGRLDDDTINNKD